MILLRNDTHCVNDIRLWRVKVKYNIIGAANIITKRKQVISLPQGNIITFTEVKILLRMFFKKVLYIVSAAWFAWFFFYLTVIVFTDIAQGNTLTATVWNFALIVFFIIFDKVCQLIYVKLNSQRAEGKKLSIPKKILKFYLGGASFKSALYLFYIVIIVCAALMAANPELTLLPYDYLISVRYGILILFAVDSFLGRIFKDVIESYASGKRGKRYTACGCQNNPAPPYTYEGQAVIPQACITYFGEKQQPNSAVFCRGEEYRRQSTPP